MTTETQSSLYEWRDGTSGRLPLVMTLEQAQSVSHPEQGALLSSQREELWD